MPKLLFVFENKDEKIWRDGLWQALNRLGEQGYEITKVNLYDSKYPYETTAGTVHTPVPDYLEAQVKEEGYDFVLGWGGFNSLVDRTLQSIKGVKKGLCIGGVVFPPEGMFSYNVLFYETNWYRPTINQHHNIRHAFGINEEIFHPSEPPTETEDKFWDWTTVGCFADWKRQTYLSKKEGRKIAVGDVQKSNMRESMAIVNHLLNNGVAVMDMQTPEFIADLFRQSKNVYIPANVIGGGERAVLEARACRANVEIEPDNPKLSELLGTVVWDSKYYAKQLKEGIESC